MQPVKFEMAINLNAAKALGTTMPAMPLARADEGDQMRRPPVGGAVPVAAKSWTVIAIQLQSIAA